MTLDSIRTRWSNFLDFIDKYKQLIGYFLILGTGIILGRVGPTIPIEYDYALIIVSISLIGIFLACLYLIKFFKDSEKIQDAMRLNEKLPQDVKMLKFHKTITFNQDSFKSGICRVKIFREFINKMKNMQYNEFKIQTSSRTYTPNFNELEFKREGKPFHDITRESSKCKLIKEYEVKGTTEEFNQLRLSLYFPVDLGPDERKNFEIEYNTNAFSEAINGRCDSTTLSVSRYIDTATIEIQLDDTIKNEYKLSRCIERKSNEPFYFEILDESNQRMWYWEQESARNFECPTINEDFVKWEIPNPKVGYSYRLYFTILKRN